MRMTLMALAAALVLICGTGCVVASSTHHNLCGKSAVVWDDEIYVVDLKACKARKVRIEPCTQSETIETIIIKEEDEARGPSDNRTLASRR